MDASTDRNKDSTRSSCSPTFLLHNNVFGSISQLSDIEMITIKSVSYTSLKDLIPTSSSPPAPSVVAIASPKVHNSIWHEIPIRNPLVKQAALAYLQPMGSPPPVVGQKGLFENVKDRCCGECGCVSWLYDVVWRKVKEAFSEKRDDVIDDNYGEDDDKVD